MFRKGINLLFTNYRLYITIWLKHNIPRLRKLWKPSFNCLTAHLLLTPTPALHRLLRTRPAPNHSPPNPSSVRTRRTTSYKGDKVAKRGKMGTHANRVGPTRTWIVGQLYCPKLELHTRTTRTCDSGRCMGPIPFPIIIGHVKQGAMVWVSLCSWRVGLWRALGTWRICWENVIYCRESEPLSPSVQIFAVTFPKFPFLSLEDWSYYGKVNPGPNPRENGEVILWIWEYQTEEDLNNTKSDKIWSPPMFS